MAQFSLRPSTYSRPICRRDLLKLLGAVVGPAIFVRTAGAQGRKGTTIKLVGTELSIDGIEHKLATGDTVVFKAENTTIKLWFPESEPFGESEVTIQAGQEEPLTVRNNAKPDEYPYAIWSENPNVVFDGPPHPVIIVIRR